MIKTKLPTQSKAKSLFQQYFCILSSFELTGLLAYQLFRFLPPSPILFSTPRLLILENFTSLPFYSRLPVYQFMCTIDSGTVNPRQSHKTIWCTCFFISMTFISIYRLRFGDFSCKFQVILHVDKLPFYFLCSFCWYFHRIVWWFYFNENSITVKLKKLKKHKSCQNNETLCKTDQIIRKTKLLRITLSARNKFIPLLPPFSFTM